MPVRMCALVSGIILSCIQLACDDSFSPVSELDGLLAYSEAGRIHVLDLSNQQDNLVYTAQTGTDIRNLTWAPDAAFIVFHTYAFGPHTQFIREWKMYRISAGGTGLTLMFDRGGPEVYPSYGPDGRLAYWGNDGLYVDGWVTYPSGGVADQSAPSWSPDGKHILLASGSDIVRLSLEDTSETYAILENSEQRSNIREPAYSPDGTQVAFVRDLAVNLSEIWIVNIDGTGERALTTGHFDRNPRWSRDGTTIAFVRNENAIYTIETDPDGRVNILLSHAVEHIAWAW
jgi:Tol biopolymer transport system component